MKFLKSLEFIFVAFIISLAFYDLSLQRKEMIVEPSKELINKIEAKYFEGKDINFNIERDYFTLNECVYILHIQKDVKVYKISNFSKKLYLAADLVIVPVNSLSPQYRNLILERYNQEKSHCENKLKQEEIKHQLNLIK